MTQIMIVDDEVDIRQMMVRYLERFGYSCLQANDGEAAFSGLASNDNCDIVLTDLSMPVMDGLTMIEKCRDELGRDVEFIVCTGKGDQEKVIRALRLGVSEFLTKPMTWKAILTALSKAIQRNAEKKSRIELVRLAQDVRDQLRNTRGQLVDARSAAIGLIVSISRFRDVETAEHCVRVGEYSSLLAQLMGRDKHYVHDIRTAATVHDIGKLGLPDSVLFKDGLLDDNERRQMQRHTTLGAEMFVDHGDNDLIRMAARIAASHHECFDGSGYPNGLVGLDIPEEARICAIADVYDALRTKRRYKPGYSHKETLNILRTGDLRTLPEHFDPAILGLFVENHLLFDDIYRSFPNS